MFFMVLQMSAKPNDFRTMAGHEFAAEYISFSNINYIDKVKLYRNCASAPVAHFQIH